MTTTIVVGSGSSGGAVAARLSEDENEHVILIEAGPDFAEERDVPEVLRDPNAYDCGSYDWGLHAYAIEPRQQRQPFPYLRGKVVGGSSAFATAALRGTHEDFDAWAAAGNDEWSWDAVLPVFRRLENDVDYPDSPIHGNTGPVPIVRAQRDAWPTMMHAFEAACVELGHPTCPDANALDATGVGPIPRSTSDGLRASSLTTYLRDVRGRPNLEIRADTTVIRVVFDRRRAIGVEVLPTDGQAHAERVHADRVVLCAGAIESPHILMLSGIGPATHLRQLGIDARVDLPVGQSLSDHPAFALLGLSADPAPTLWGPRVQLEYTSEHGPRNDMWVRTALLPPGPMFEPPPGVKAAVWLSGVLGMPRSSGSLHLASADPSVHPELRFNYFDDPADLERAREIIRTLRTMATQSPLAEEISQIVTPSGDVVDDDHLDTWLRQTAGTAYHAACTCPMGPREDARSVVNQRLAVHDTDGLYVADASVMPQITTIATNLTCVMIGERMADILRDDR